MLAAHPHPLFQSRCSCTAEQGRFLCTAGLAWSPSDTRYLSAEMAKMPAFFLLPQLISGCGGLAGLEQTPACWGHMGGKGGKFKTTPNVMEILLLASH